MNSSQEVNRKYSVEELSTFGEKCDQLKRLPIGFYWPNREGTRIKYYGPPELDDDIRMEAFLAASSLEVFKQNLLETSQVFIIGSQREQLRKTLFYSGVPQKKIIGMKREEQMVKYNRGFMELKHEGLLRRNNCLEMKATTMSSEKCFAPLRKCLVQKEAIVLLSVSLKANETEMNYELKNLQEAFFELKEVEKPVNSMVIVQDYVPALLLVL